MAVALAARTNLELYTPAHCDIQLHFFKASHARMRVFPHLLIASSALGLGCVTDTDCSLNGHCVVWSGVCTCNPGWTGDSCASLNITTIDPLNGRNQLQNGSSSWGGGVIYDNGLYHMYYSQMVMGCSLANWTSHSACWHASAANALGPFEVQGQVLDAFCHNAVPALAPDGTWLIYHIGCGGGNPTPCAGHSATGITDRPSASVAHDAAARDPAMGCGVMNPTLMYSTAGPNGPWQPIGYQILNGTDGSNWDSVVTNVAPYFLPNGTVLLAFRGKDPSNKELLGVASAPHWSGPYTKSVAGPILPSTGEDPFPYIDQQGNYHILFHDFKEGGYVGGHVYATSWSGPWYYSQVPPYTTAVTWSNGTDAKLSRRERPQLYFDPATGAPQVLYNGVVPGPDAASMQCFTMAAAIGN